MHPYCGHVPDLLYGFMHANIIVVIIIIDGSADPVWQHVVADIMTNYHCLSLDFRFWPLA